MLFEIGCPPKFAMLSKILWEIWRFWKLISARQRECLLQGEPHEEGRWNINTDCRLTKYVVLGKSHVFISRISQTVVWSTSCMVYHPRIFFQPLVGLRRTQPGILSTQVKKFRACRREKWAFQHSCENASTSSISLQNSACGCRYNRHSFISLFVNLLMFNVTKLL